MRHSPRASQPSCVTAAPASQLNLDDQGGATPCVAALVRHSRSGALTKPERPGGAPLCVTALVCVTAAPAPQLNLNDQGEPPRASQPSCFTALVCHSRSGAPTKLAQGEPPRASPLVLRRPN